MTVSAAECPVSASIATLPVISPATSLPTALAKFAPIAASTVVLLSAATGAVYRNLCSRFVERQSVLRPAEICDEGANLVKNSVTD